MANMSFILIVWFFLLLPVRFALLRLPPGGSQQFFYFEDLNAICYFKLSG